MAVDLQGLDGVINSMITKSDSLLGGTYGNRKATVCAVCGKEGTMKTIKDHIESNHIEGIFHTCNICGKASRSRQALRVHISSYHKQ